MRVHCTDGKDVRQIFVVPPGDKYSDTDWISNV